RPASWASGIANEPNGTTETPRHEVRTAAAGRRTDERAAFAGPAETIHRSSVRVSAGSSGVAVASARSPQERPSRSYMVTVAPELCVTTSSAAAGPTRPAKSRKTSRADGARKELPFAGEF